MRSLKHPIVIFGIIVVVALAVMKINVKSMIDNARERRYAHSGDLIMTVGLVWPPASNEIDRRYSYAAGAQFAVDSFVKAGRLKGICKGIRLKEIDEVSPQSDCMDDALRDALSDPSLTAILGLASSVDAHRAAILTAGRGARRTALVLSRSESCPRLRLLPGSHLYGSTERTSPTLNLSTSPFLPTQKFAVKDKI